MKGLSPSEIRQLILSVGTRKSVRPLSPIEVGKLIQKALNAGEKREEIADRLHLDGSTLIGRFIRLLTLPDHVQPLIGWGADPATLSFTAASMIARLDSAQDQDILTKASLESQLNKSEIIEVVQIRQRSGNSIENCIKAVLNLRPIIEKRHLIFGQLQSEELITVLKQTSQHKRDSLLQSAIERQALNITPLNTKLGDRYFLLVGDEQFHNEIISLSDDFEKTITEYLLVELREKE